jgi:hypothetical protein
MRIKLPADQLVEIMPKHERLGWITKAIGLLLIDLAWRIGKAIECVGVVKGLDSLNIRGLCGIGRINLPN